MKIENGFIIGKDWHSRATVMINVDSVLKIVLDCGNMPPANRLYFKDGNYPHIDLLVEPENG